MRDPFPSQYIPSTDALLQAETAEGSPTKISLSPGLIEKNKSPWSKVDFGSFENYETGSMWSRLSSWIEPRSSRVEPLQSLQEFQHSKAAKEGFYYIGNGYFFSTFNADAATTAAKYLMESLEGTLFDWQIGDFVSSCNAGDIRVHFKVQHPSVVSLIGRLVESEDDRLSLDTFATLSEPKMGCLQDGVKTAQQLLDNRIGRTKWRRVAAFLLLWPFSYLVSRLFGAWRGLELRADHGKPTPTSKLTIFMFVLGVWLLEAFVIWTAVWKFEVGPKREAPIVALIAAGLLQHAYKNTAKASTAPGPRAVWCMLARACGLPPNWRVEKTYKAESSEAFPIEKAQGHHTGGHELRARKSPRRKKAD